MTMSSTRLTDATCWCQLVGAAVAELDEAAAAAAAALTPDEFPLPPPPTTPSSRAASELPEVADGCGGGATLAASRLAGSSTNDSPSRSAADGPALGRPPLCARVKAASNASIVSCGMGALPSSGICLRH